MLGVAFLITFFQVCLVLGILAVIRYAAPDSIPGQISISLVG